MSEVDASRVRREIIQGGPIAYVIGFLSSLVLTIISFALVMNHVLSLQWAIVAIVSLAIIQLFVQLFFFLHIGHESNRRWNIIALLLAVVVVGMVVAGSVWIMRNLNYNMTLSQQEINKYMRDNEGL